jgi:hypothetical protein
MNDTTHTPSSATLHAQCRCGSFKFASAQPPFLQLTCHCEQCRQVAKTPSTNFAFFKLAVTQVQGETITHTFKADSGATTYRETCASCGDMVVDRSEGFPKMIGVVAERIQAPYNFAPRCHVWVESKQPDVVLDDGLPVFARGMA